MDLSWQSMITQVLAVLYVAWLTFSLRATQQNMDKYVENYLTVNYAMEDINEIIAAQNAQLVEIKAQMSPNEKIEKKFSHLEAAYERIEAKVIRLEKTNIQLKEDFKEHNEMRKEQVTKVNQLEAKVKHQELLILALQNEIKTSPAAAPSQPSNGIDRSLNSGPIINGNYRTCNEIRLADASLPSGMYWIDPDGNRVGGSPIYVYCNMTTGSTVIKHDSELPVGVGHCAGVGCYSRTINYNATMEQLTALAKCSAECHQSIRYDCNRAPLELNNIAYSWWNDRSGSARYFWSGVENIDEGTHTCQCGIDGNCVDPNVKCNCDSLSPAQLFDSGVIRDKKLLPVTGLNFGRTQLKTSSGVHTLGSFECSGQGIVMPTSCEDLWRTGHSLSGIYLVMGFSAMVETVFCDFNNKTGFQKLIGYADVKSTPTFFHVRRSDKFDEIGVPITYKYSLVNRGEAMDETTGIFTVSRAGTYFFSFSGFSAMLATQSSASQFFEIFLYLNDSVVSYDNFGGSVLATDSFEFVPIQAMLDLQPGDQICVALSSRTKEAYLHSVDHFIGWMLEEKIGAKNN
ncbi:uncharacterized protein LOC124336158 isoform X2 [Daphnia pulicaria]|uniref:uncharacterized protein LOC124336158 isoform X2 n=1 Tax=Daphnia pulicaria TaxID=35523 RepID=UPI001EEB3BCC|nr:uncharacterized protein LOC124336158 isoform X2 [Daphnia pulicaria]